MSAQLSLSLVDEDDDDLQGKLLPDTAPHVEEQQQKEIRQNSAKVEKLWQVIYLIFDGT
jgi:hypothetical protein